MATTSRACLAMSPKEDETNQDFYEHITFLRFFLELFGKDEWNVLGIVGDNCNVNQSISTKLGFPLLGCASHRFQLGVREIIEEEEVIISNV